MQFTYQAYVSMINRLIKKGYSCSDYESWKDNDRNVILRHDVDMDVEKAVKMARIEKEYGIKSTYFLLLSTDFYNVFSKRNRDYIQEILSYGHNIGLHFDEKKYEDINRNVETFTVYVKKEASILEAAIKTPVKYISMHRPSQWILDSDLYIPGCINSYSNLFMKEFKYVSDSRKEWRENVEAIIENGKHDRLHILTHAFWYHNEDFDLRRDLQMYVERAGVDRYRMLRENIRDMESVLSPVENDCK